MEVRRDSRASQQDRKPRPPDQPPPTASKTRGRKRSPVLAHGAAVLWKRDLRDSTCWNTVSESQSALDRMEGQRVLQMEKSQVWG